MGNRSLPARAGSKQGYLDRKSRMATESANRSSDSLERRIGSRIKPQPNGCWLFNGVTDPYYGTWKVAGETLQVHRFVYETLVGPIPDGHDIHHICETKACCNPEHLTPMTRSDHMKHHRRKLS